jgi:hypothetical protein
MKFLIALTIIIANLLSGCGGKTEYDYPITSKQRREQNMGSLVSEDKEGGITIFGGKKDKKSNSSIGVNEYLWQAALDVISFMPLQQSDPIGGVILTDWYADAKAPTERFKMNVIISGAELQVTAVKVTVFKQSLDNKGNWQSAIANDKLARELEDKIINRARQIKIGNTVK